MSYTATSFSEIIAFGSLSCTANYAVTILKQGEFHKRNYSVNDTKTNLFVLWHYRVKQSLKFGSLNINEPNFKGCFTW